MAEQKKRTQADKAASAAKARSEKTRAKVSAKKTEHRADAPVNERQIPVRLISALVFLALFILFFVIFIEPEGVVILAIDSFVHGLIGGVGFIVAIPVFLYLFVIHAFSGKRPVKMRTISLLLFIVTCGCINHMFLNLNMLKSANLQLFYLFH